MRGSSADRAPTQLTSVPARTLSANRVTTSSPAMPRPTSSLEVLAKTRSMAATATTFYSAMPATMLFPAPPGATPFLVERVATFLTAAPGPTRLRGGPGKDFLTGGSDADIFDFTSLADSKRGASRDVITDFVPAFDQISLFAIDANSHKSGNQAFKFIGLAAFSP